VEKELPGNYTRKWRKWRGSTQTGKPKSNLKSLKKSASRRFLPVGAVVQALGQG
jgi:hypothetical protein